MVNSLYPARDFRMANVLTKDGTTVEVPTDVNNEKQMRPYQAILIVKTNGKWRFICEYWETSVAVEQAKVFAYNSANQDTQVLPYPVVPYSAPRVSVEPLQPLAAKAVVAEKKARATKPKTVIKVVEPQETPDASVLPEPIKAHRRGRKVADGTSD